MYLPTDADDQAADECRRTGDERVHAAAETIAGRRLGRRDEDRETCRDKHQEGNYTELGFSCCSVPTSDDWTSKNQLPRPLIEVFLCFDSEALCAALIQRGAPATKALLHFGAADILEPVGQQNGESGEMYQPRNTLRAIYGASFRSSNERPGSSAGGDR